MKAWEHHNKIIREKKLKARQEATRAGELETLDKQADNKAAMELLLAALDGENKRLHALPQGNERISLKRELVKEYLPIVEKYLTTGEVYQYPALTQVMIWLFDIGEADFVLEWAEDQKDDRDVGPGLIEPYFGEVYDCLFPEGESEAAEAQSRPVVRAWQIHEDIKIKYVKMAIAQAEKAGEPEKALKLCELAESINPKKAQVKTRKVKLEKEIAKAAEEAKHRQRAGAEH